MLRINHNIGEVLRWLDKVEDRLQTKTMPATLQPRFYLPDLQRVTRQVLGVILETPEEREQIEPLSNAIVSWAPLWGMEFSLTASADLAALNPGDIEPEQLALMAPEIAAWAEEYKRLDSRRAADAAVLKDGDWGKMAKHLIAVIREDPAAWTKHLAELRDQPGLLQYLWQENPEGFAKAFGAAGAGISPERLSNALVAVLDAWETLLGVRLVKQAAVEVNKALA